MCRHYLQGGSKVIEPCRRILTGSVKPRPQIAQIKVSSLKPKKEKHPRYRSGKQHKNAGKGKKRRSQRLRKVAGEGSERTGHTKRRQTRPEHTIMSTEISSLYVLQPVFFGKIEHPAVEIWVLTPL